MRIALYAPDIPQNTGTILRLAACLGLAVDIIEPAGFDMSDRALRRAGLDYLTHVKIARHVDFGAFENACRAAGHRLVLLTTKAQTVYIDFAFAPDDVLLLGRESGGVPGSVHAAADARIKVPVCARPAFPQHCRGGQHGRWRSVAADRRVSGRFPSRVPRSVIGINHI